MNVSGNKITIAAGSVKAERVTCNFIYCEKSSGTVRLRLPDGSTVIFKTGKKIKLSEQVSVFWFENNSDEEVTVDYIAGFGDVSDDSIKLEGSIEVDSKVNSYKQWSLQRFNTSKPIYIKSIGEKVLIQNIGATDITVGCADGFVINPGGSMDLPLSSNFYVYPNGAASFVVALFANSKISSIDFEEIENTETGSESGELYFNGGEVTGW